MVEGNYVLSRNRFTFNRRTQVGCILKRTNAPLFIKLLTYFIALVWLANGLWAKVLHGVPRHQEIVARILGSEYASELTILIGLSEIATAIWIVFGKHRKLTAIAQIAIVLTMNLLETFLAQDLLLWGKCNLVFALLFCGLVYLHGFTNTEKHAQA